MELWKNREICLSTLLIDLTEVKKGESGSEGEGQENGVNGRKDIGSRE